MGDAIIKNYPSNLDSTHYDTTEFPSDKIKNMVLERNKLLIKFGETCIDLLFDVDDYLSTYRHLNAKMKFGDSPNVRLVGNPNQPTLVFFNKYVLSIFVKNFKVYLSSDFKDGSILGIVNLNDLNNTDTLEDVRDIVQDSEVLGEGVNTKILYKIERNKEGMFFSNFDNQGNAYYSATNPKLFFNEDDAIKVMKSLVGFKTPNVILNIV